MIGIIEYVTQVKELPYPVLMYNNYVDVKNRANGGCYVFYKGEILALLPMGHIGVLEYDI